MAMSASVTPGGAAKSMSATHIGSASGASMPDNFAIFSHLLACVPRRSITRSKSNMSPDPCCHPLVPACNDGRRLASADKCDGWRRAAPQPIRNVVRWDRSHGPEDLVGEFSDGAL